MSYKSDDNIFIPNKFGNVDVQFLPITCSFWNKCFRTDRCSTQRWAEFLKYIILFWKGIATIGRNGNGKYICNVSRNRSISILKGNISRWQGRQVKYWAHQKVSCSILLRSAFKIGEYHACILNHIIRRLLLRPARLAASRVLNVPLTDRIFKIFNEWNLFLFREAYVD